MYNNNEYTHSYDYDKRVELIDAKSREVLQVFYARDVVPESQSAGFVGGGIASGGQAYTIATLDDIKNIKAYNMQVIIDGEKEYKIVGIRHTEDGTSALHTYKKKYETVLYLN